MRNFYLVCVRENNQYLTMVQFIGQKFLRGQFIGKKKWDSKEETEGKTDFKLKLCIILSETD